MVQSAMTSRRLARAEEQPLTVEELLVWLGHASPAAASYLDTLREWGVHAALVLAKVRTPSRRVH